MFQNSAYGTPMLDGNLVHPEIYSHTPTEDKMDVVSQPQLNNNNIEVVNRNSGLVFGSTRQWYDIETRKGHDTLHASFDTNRSWYVSEQIQPAQSTQNNHLLTPAACNGQPFKTDDNNTTSPQIDEEIIPKTAENIIPDGTLEQSIMPQVLPASPSAVEAAKPTEMVAVVTKVSERRPMNAFLLFCKRHRPVLKKHFREENRDITKKLGKWWKILKPEQQKPYKKLAEKYKTKYLNVNPGYRWCKTSATACATNADPSLNEGNTDRMATEPDPEAISQDRLEAAHTLVRLGEGVNNRCPPATMSANGGPMSFTLAADSNMGRLRELYLDKADAGQFKESQSNRFSISVPCVSKPQDHTDDGAENTARTERSCKGNRYPHIMNQMYPRAQSKRSTVSKKTQKVLNGGASTTSDRALDAGCVPEHTEAEARNKQLEMERDKELSNIRAMNIDHFLAIQHSEKRRKKAKTPVTKAATKTAILPTSPDNPDIQASIGGPISKTDHSTSVPDNIVPVMVKVEQPAIKPVGCRKRKPPRDRITRLAV
ncbi:uncharacterized protein LOC126567188 [Anopheles maculipalpis]|uniref:uncharacterized protein LOC126567188 n=1 Tax=Anopheles maculipalpis TaxID=1496333 RepID=UPI002158D0C8|nr:uncharacterized protein LOC126567188 [Anopheles maculipalpis]